jgi:hypothetical protein
MNGIMSRKLRERQHSDKSLLNFTKGNATTSRRDGWGSRRGASCTRLGRGCALRCQALLELGGKLLGLLVGELQLAVKDQAHLVGAVILE